MRILVRRLAVGLSLLGLAACQSAGPEPDLGSGPRTGTVTVAGVARTYRVHVPASVAASSVALVVMLHGGFGSGEQAERAYGWNDEADRAGFVVAYPDGDGRAWSVGGGCCGRSGRSGTDDVAVVEAVVADIARTVPVDPHRIYATGMSNGAMLAYRLACDSTVFAAIAPVAGTLMGECAEPAAISVLHIHGLADRNVPYDGSRGVGVAAIDGAPVESTVDLFRRAAGCEPATASTVGEVTRSVASCPDGRAVELVTIATGAHQWPADATPTIWGFFAEHPAREAIRPVRAPGGPPSGRP